MAGVAGNYPGVEILTCSEDFKVPTVTVEFLPPQEYRSDSLDERP